MLRRIIEAVPLASAWLLAAGLGAAAQPGPQAPMQTVSIRLSSFSFTPDHLVLKAGVPVRLRLTNESSGGHDFSAPAFLASSTILPGSRAPVGGAADVPGEQTIELMVTPRTPGHYPVTCTHFLHGFFGMNGTIDETSAALTIPLPLWRDM